MKEPASSEEEITDEHPGVPPSKHIKWSRYYRLLRTHWWVPVLCVGLAMVIAGWHVAATPNLYLSEGRMMVAGQILLPDNAIYSEEEANFFGTQISLMESQSVRTAAEASLHAKRPDLKECQVTFKATQQPRSSLFALQAIGQEPKYTQALLDALMREYINAKEEMRSEKSDTTVSAIAEQLDALEKRIRAGEEDLFTFQKENNVHFLEAEGNSAGTYLSGIDKKLADLNTEFKLLNMLSLDANIDRQQAAASAGTGNQVNDMGSGFIEPNLAAQGDYIKAKQTLKLLKAKLQDFSQFLRPKHPRMVQLNDQIALQEKLIGICKEESEAQLNDQRESVRLQIDNLQNERKEWSAKALDLSERSARYESLKSKVDRLKALYDRLLTRMQAVDVSKNISQSNVAILEKASPGRPLKMDLEKVLSTALVAGVSLGLLILFVGEKLDDRIITAEEFSLRFPFQILGHIPKMDAKKMSLVSPKNPAFTEAFSALRSSLLFLPKTVISKTILVTSAVPHEGKTTVAANLSATLAKGGASVLLVDADFRRGEQHKLFGLSNETGLSNIVKGETDWHQTVQKCEVDNLSVITRGKSIEETSEHLAGWPIVEFVNQVSAEYDFVIFDSCPVFATDDTTMLAPKIDAVVYVARLGFSTGRTIKAAHELLANRQVNVLGFVLNMLDRSIDRSNYYCYSYREYYSKQSA